MDRTFLTPAYLVEDEPGVFGLYRNIEVERRDPRTGKIEREKIKAIGPMDLLREAREGEIVDLQTVHPVTGCPIRLVSCQRNVY